MNKKQSYQEPTLELNQFETCDAVLASAYDNGDGTFDNVGRLPGGWSGL